MSSSSHDTPPLVTPPPPPNGNVPSPQNNPFAVDAQGRPVPANMAQHDTAASGPIATPPQPGVPPHHDNSYTMAIIGLALAIIVPIVGLVLSIVALAGISKRPQREGRGLAIAGIVVASVQIVLFVVAMVGMLLLGWAIDSNGWDDSDSSRNDVPAVTDDAYSRDDDRIFELDNLSIALYSYYQDNKSYPTESAFASQRWSDPYREAASISEGSFSDVDGKAYKYDTSGAACTDSGCDRYSITVQLERIFDGGKEYTVRGDKYQGLPVNEN